MRSVKFVSLVSFGKPTCVFTLQSCKILWNGLHRWFYRVQTPRTVVNCTWLAVLSSCQNCLDCVGLEYKQLGHDYQEQQVDYQSSNFEFCYRKFCSLSLPSFQVIFFSCFFSRALKRRGGVWNVWSGESRRSGFHRCLHSRLQQDKAVWYAGTHTMYTKSQ